MESLRLRAAIAIGLILLSVADPAAARRREARVETTDDGVEAELTVGDDGTVTIAPVGGGGSSGCSDWDSIPMQFTGRDRPPEYGTPPSADAVLFLVFCDGEYLTWLWAEPNSTQTIVDTRALANTVIETIPVDLASINARPQAEAITGIPSYFWVEGYDGAPITGSVTNGPVTVNVSVSLGTVTWDFGDGTPPYTGTLGEAWPDRSSVRHTYKDKGAYIVTVTIVLPAEFTVNGSGVVTQLPPVIRTAQFPYQVDEVQAVRER